jgi:hypothetical protein
MYALGLAAKIALIKLSLVQSGFLEATNSIERGEKKERKDKKQRKA